MKSNVLSGLRAASSIVVLAGLVACSGAGQDQTVADFGIAYIKRPIETETVNIVPVDSAGNPLLDSAGNPLPAVPVIRPVETDVREAIAFHEGGDVYLRDRASPSASERNITLCLTDLDGDGIGTGDVRDLESSYDGTKLIFSLRLEDLTNGDNVPKWNIYEYDTTIGGCPTLVIQDPFTLEAGDDVAPAYLPDGRIVFSSNAAVKTGEVLLNEGKSQFSPMDEDLREFAVVLHVMDADGTNIKQISFNQSHDLDASVLSSGEIVFSRWDGAGSKSAIRLYTIHPDGTELKALYGLHDANVGTGGSTVQFLAPRELEDGQILAMLKPFTGSAGGGAPVKINTAGFADINQPTIPNLGILTGPGQVLAINQDVRTDGSISPAGRYRSVYPLLDGSNRALVSWSQCRLQPTDATGIPTAELPEPCPESIPANSLEAFPLYGIYVYDFTQDTQLPVVIPEEGVIIDEPVVLAPRDRPAVIIDKDVGFELDQALADVESAGILHIRSVYDFDGKFDALGAQKTLGGAVTTLAEMADPTITSADQRPARYLRIVKAAAIPDPNADATAFDAGIAFGAGGRRGGMREIIGYAPIEPDGSVMVKVPANVPLSIQVVDKDGRSISERHLNWIQVAGGETLECGGCHNHNPTQPVPAPVTPVLPVPHGYSDAPTPLNTGAQITVPNWVFPGTTTDDPMTPTVDETIFPQQGETMAQARIRVSCTNGSGIFVITQTGCPELSPSPNPVFFDVWAKAAPSPDDISLRYADLNVLMGAGIPATLQCTPGSGLLGAKWDATCRTIINYETSIHPLWSLPRTDLGGTLDRTCTSCHSNVDAGGMPMVPAAQLDLGEGLRGNDNDPDRFKSYQELFVNDAVKWQLVGMTLEAVTEEVPLVVNGVPVYKTTIDPITMEVVTVIDPVTGLPDPVLVTQNVAPDERATMSVRGARFSPNFFDRFNTPGDINHEGILTRAEIRLLSEWLDIGGQYFNNTFDAP